jgi:hypothetical protein
VSEAMASVTAKTSAGASDREHPEVEIQPYYACCSDASRNQSRYSPGAASDVQNGFARSRLRSTNEFGGPYRRYPRHEVLFVKLGGTANQLPILVLRHYRERCDCST